jgi:hypothetical protein
VSEVKVQGKLTGVGLFVGLVVPLTEGFFVGLGVGFCNSR